MNDFVFGFHSVSNFIRHRSSAVKEIMVDESRDDARLQKLLQLAKKHELRIIKVNRTRLNQLMGQDVVHQGVVAAIEKTDSLDLSDILKTSPAEPFLFLVLDGVEDPHNLGACFRTACAMGAHAIILPKDRAVSVNATVRKVACGAVDIVPFVIVANLARALSTLQENDVFLIGADTDSTQKTSTVLYDTDLTQATALVMGGEAKGLRKLTKEACDQLAHIPMAFDMESLNVSVAVGIFLSEAFRQRRLIR